MLASRAFRLALRPAYGPFFITYHASQVLWTVVGVPMYPNDRFLLNVPAEKAFANPQSQYSWRSTLPVQESHAVASVYSSRYQPITMFIPQTRLEGHYVATSRGTCEFVSAWGKGTSNTPYQPSAGGPLFIREPPTYRATGTEVLQHMSQNQLERVQRTAAGAGVDTLNSLDAPLPTNSSRAKNASLLAVSSADKCSTPDPQGTRTGHLSPKELVSNNMELVRPGDSDKDTSRKSINYACLRREKGSNIFAGPIKTSDVPYHTNESRVQFNAPKSIGLQTGEIGQSTDISSIGYRSIEREATIAHVGEEVLARAPSQQLPATAKTAPAFFGKNKEHRGREEDAVIMNRFLTQLPDLNSIQFGSLPSRLCQENPKELRSPVETKKIFLGGLKNPGASAITQDSSDDLSTDAAGRARFFSRKTSRSRGMTSLGPGDSRGGSASRSINNAAESPNASGLNFREKDRVTHVNPIGPGGGGDQRGAPKKRSQGKLKFYTRTLKSPHISSSIDSAAESLGSVDLITIDTSSPSKTGERKIGTDRKPKRILRSSPVSPPSFKPPDNAQSKLEGGATAGMDGAEVLRPEDEKGAITGVRRPKRRDVNTHKLRASQTSDLPALNQIKQKIQINSASAPNSICSTESSPSSAKSSQVSKAKQTGRNFVEVDGGQKHRGGNQKRKGRRSNSKGLLQSMQDGFEESAINAQSDQVLGAEKGQVMHSISPQVIGQLCEKTLPTESLQSVTGESHDSFLRPDLALNEGRDDVGGKEKLGTRLKIEEEIITEFVDKKSSDGNRKLESEIMDQESLVPISVEEILEDPKASVDEPQDQNHTQSAHHIRASKKSSKKTQKRSKRKAKGIKKESPALEIQEEGIKLEDKEEILKQKRGVQEETTHKRDKLCKKIDPDSISEQVPKKFNSHQGLNQEILDDILSSQQWSLVTGVNSLAPFPHKVYRRGSGETAAYVLIATIEGKES